MILSFWTDWSGQTVKTQIRLLLEEQSDQRLHCLLFNLHVFLTKYPKVWTFCFNLRYITAVLLASENLGAMVHKIFSAGGV